MNTTNKGVVSKILPDEEMPFLENGEHVDVIFNSLGVINRLNSYQLYELSITFICDNVVAKLATMDNLKEQEELLFDIINIFNSEQHKKLTKYYKKLSEKGKKEFMQDTIESGINIHIPPMWEDEPLFDRLIKIYDKYEWIKPYDVYINKFDRKIKIMKPLIVGSMYVIKMKQSSKKGFSVRSTGALSRKGIPQKSNKAKNHQELYSQTPIRIGDQENNNSVIGVDSDIIAKLHLFYRSSVIGRRSMGKELATNINELKTIDYDKNFKNRNVEIMQAKFKVLGLALKFDEPKMVIDINMPGLTTYKDDDKLYILSRQDEKKMKVRKEIIEEYSEDKVFVGSKKEWNEFLDKESEKRYKHKDKLVIDIKI